MNERIKALAEQANIFTHTKYYDPVPATFLKNGDEVQKFAELIIKKCGSVAYESVESGRASGCVRSDIEDYFGVE